MYAEFNEPSLPPTRLSTRRMAAGVALSLAAHALLLLASRQGWLPRPAPSLPEPTLMVWVRPAAPPLPPPEPAADTERSVHAPARTAARRPSPASAGAPAAPAVIAMDPAPDQPPAPDSLAVPPAQPAFDMEAARAAARALANEADPARASLPVAQFDRNRQISSDTKLARDIARAKRRDCKDGIPGGLLAPVYLLMQKKDHGCQW